MSLIDIHRKKRIESGLLDNHDNATSVAEAYEELHTFIAENMADEDPNTCKVHVYPFLGIMTTEIVKQLFGDEGAAMILAANPFVRVLMIHSIMAGFYARHMLEEKQLSFNTVEEDLTDEQLHDFQVKQGLVEATLTAIMAGHDPTEVVQGLYRTGKITDDDVEKYGLEELVKDVEQNEEPLGDN
tara:strand:+ start:888 stop:1442 length:555 start_codon:yes stop_codon:yes gene_type:complete